MTLGEYISKARWKTGLSQKQVSKFCGISSQFLCDIEHNRRLPSKKVLDSIARWLLLDGDQNYMYFLMGKLNPDFITTSVELDAFNRAFEVFRDILDGSEEYEYQE